MVPAYGCSDCLSAPKPPVDANPAARPTPPKTCRKNCRRRTGTAGPPPAATATELGARREDPTSPSPPTRGGEGRGEEGCCPDSETPLPSPLPVRAPRGEGEDRCLPTA